MTDNDHAETEAPPRKRQRRTRNNYAEMYRDLRRRADLAVRLLGRVKGGADAGTANLELVTAAAELLCDKE